MKKQTAAAQVAVEWVQQSTLQGEVWRERGLV